MSEIDMQNATEYPDWLATYQVALAYRLSPSEVAKWPVAAVKAALVFEATRPIVQSVSPRVIVLRELLSWGMPMRLARFIVRHIPRWYLSILARMFGGAQ